MASFCPACGSSKLTTLGGTQKNNCGAPRKTVTGLRQLNAKQTNVRVQ